VLRTALALLADLLRLLRLMVRSRGQLAAENLFLRKQLACYIERRVRPRRTDNASRIASVLLSRIVKWRELLTIVRPDTFVRWHRDLFRLFYRLKSRPRGRPRIPADVQQLIAEMAEQPYLGRGADCGGAPREARAYRFLVHDRDGIFAPVVDEAIQSMSLQVLKTPVRAPQANAHCERFIGTVRRECPTTLTGHRLPAAHRIVVSPRLGGLHHHYQLVPVAA
jgi:hypothetical protein